MLLLILSFSLVDEGHIKMKSIEEIKKLLSEHKKEFQEKYGLSVIGIFGSYVRGEQVAESDVDILVEFCKPIGFVRFIQLENYFSALLGIKVDLVTKKALKPYIGEQILREVQYV